jgi:two-component system chemotaxis sensor kinase CheA
MSIELSQFISTFLEESYEGLDIMESGLLNFNSSDEEAINTIFRAAHSIKGGAGTFGFNDVADFTHDVETLLDEMRSDKQESTPTLVNLLLESTDCIRALLEASQEGPEVDAQMISQVQMRLKEVLGIEADTTDVEAADTPSQGTPAQHNDTAWSVHFIPNSNLLQSGHEPLFMFDALSELGELKIEVATDIFPSLSGFKPEEVYLSWKLLLVSECSEEDIKEVFEWVEDECELNIFVSQVPSKSEVEADSGWSIRFVPDADIIKTGNDPALMFEALFVLGDATVTPRFDNLPQIQDLAADQLYLFWEIHLISACTKEEILEIFEWVEDDCDLEITRLPGVSQTTTNDSNSAPLASPTTTSIAPSSTPDVQPKAAETAVKSKGKSTAANAKKSAEASSIRVDTEKVDSLINRVGELVITQAMLGQVGADLTEITTGPEVERLQTGLELLERNTRDLQEDVMRVRMLPISFVFNRFPRLVHDVSGKLGKKVELVLSGEQTEIDKTVMEKIGDPMTHLIRNSLDHGLETPAERLAAGKSETGKVELSAYHQGGHIIIDIIDDGRGLNTKKIYEKACEKGLINTDQQLSDQEINELVFKAGFSTADEVTDLSGRGVGMDVVRRNIESLGGQVSIKSEANKGSTFSVKLPLTLAILEGQLVRIHEDTYIIPLVSIVETILANNSAINSIAGASKLLHFREDYISLLNLKNIFKLNTASPTDEMESNLIAIVESGGKKVGLIVDELYGQQQVVIKSLEVNFKRIEGLSGATILGDGSVALILDVAGLMQRGQAFELEAALKEA